MSQCRITNTDNWETFAGLPLTGAIKVNDGNSVVHISAYFPEDRRGKYSYYAATSDELQKTVVFLFVVEDDGLLLQAVKNNAHYPVTNGMCVSLHSPCNNTCACATTRRVLALWSISSASVYVTVPFTVPVKSVQPR